MKGWMMMLFCFHVFNQMLIWFVGCRVVNKADVLNIRVHVHT